MSQSRLIFYPCPPEKSGAAHNAIEHISLASILEQTGFIDTLKIETGQYLAGEHFLNLLTFLGCSPNIQLSPQDGENYCAITLLDVTQELRCLGYTRSAKPKCPACTKRISDWQSEHWRQGDLVCICDKCQTETFYAQLNWKHECGYALCGFEVSHIYPFEALPTEQFLAALGKTSGFKWTYCYANNSL